MIEYNGLKINPPTGWDNLSLGLYEQVCYLPTSTHKERVTVISALCGVDAWVVLAAPLELFVALAEAVDWYFQSPDPEPVNYFEYGGVKYFAIDGDTLSLGEWIDVGEAQKGDAVLSGVLAVVCRPLGEAYDPKTAEARALLFQGLPVTTVLGVLAFFLANKRRSTTIENKYSELVHLTSQLPHGIRDFVKGGVGIKWWRILRITRYLILIKLLNYRLKKLLHT